MATAKQQRENFVYYDCIYILKEESFVRRIFIFDNRRVIEGNIFAKAKLGQEVFNWNIGHGRSVFVTKVAIFIVLNGYVDVGNEKISRVWLFQTSGYKVKIVEFIVS